MNRTQDFLCKKLVKYIGNRKNLLQEQNDSDILTISESVRFLIVIYEFRFGKSANAFSKFLEIIEKPRK
ncbi:MAG: hypothetical protein IJN54_07660, partial [Lachnospiraceae bacterium]|nr:hypothetical protein [Lachnospiraceae bacterium]